MMYTRFFSRLVVVCFAFLLLAGAQPVTAQQVPAGDGIRFIEGQPLKLTLALEQEQSCGEVHVLNATGAPQTVTLQLIQFVDAKKNPLPAGAFVLTPASAVVQPGQSQAFSACFQRIEDLTGSFSGDLVAVAGEAGLARLAVSLEVAAVEAPVPELLETNRVNPTFTGEVEWQAVSAVPSWLVSKKTGASTGGIAIDIPIEYSAVSQPRIVGQVVGQQGTGYIWLEPGPQLSVTGIRRAGKYAGSLAIPVAGEEKDKSIKLSLNVRDGWWYALLALVLGLLAAHLLERIAPENSHALKLKYLLEQVKADARKIQAAFAASPALPQGWSFYQIITQADDPTNEDGLLVSEARDMQDQYRHAITEKARERWGPDGEMLAELSKDVDQMEAMNEKIAQMQGPYQELKTAVTNFDQLPVGAAVQNALPAAGMQLIKTDDELTGADARVTAAAAFLQSYRQIYTYLKNTLETDLIKGPNKDLVKSWFAQLETMQGIADLPTLESYAAKWKNSIIEWKNAQGWGRGVEEEEPSAVEFGAAGRREEKEGKALAQYARRLNYYRLIYAVLAGAAVLATGFNTLYLANPTFGSPSDYINALLWGVTIGAGFQIARSLLPVFK